MSLILVLPPLVATACTARQLSVDEGTTNAPTGTGGAASISSGSGGGGAPGTGGAGGGGPSKPPTDDGGTGLPPDGGQVTVTVAHTHKFTVPGQVTWQVVGGAADGVVDDTGLYTAPPVPRTAEVRATGVVDPTSETTFTVVVAGTGVAPVAGTFHTPKAIAIEDATTAWVTDANAFLQRVNLGTGTVDVFSWTDPAEGAVFPPSGVMVWGGVPYATQGCSFQAASPATSAVRFLMAGGPGGCIPDDLAAGLYGLVTDGTTLYYAYPDNLDTAIFAKPLADIETSYDYTILAGNIVYQGEGAQDGTGAAVRMHGPRGLAVDGAGGLYFADEVNHTIRRIVVSSGETTTFAGALGTAGFADGTADQARFNGPQGIAYDPRGALYVADHGNGLVRRIDLATREVTTVAGTLNHFTVTPGPLPASIGHPMGLALTSDKDLLVTADVENAVAVVHLP